jgi:hypothetical protein
LKSTPLTPLRWVAPRQSMEGP